MDIVSKLANRLFPDARLLWGSSNGPAMRNPKATGPRYIAKPIIKKKSKARKLTEAEDNAIGRKLRRRRNKAAKPWRPHAKR